MKLFKSIWNFIAWHPLYTWGIIWLTWILIYYAATDKIYIGFCFLMAIVTMGFLSLPIRRTRNREFDRQEAEQKRIQKEKDMDELARRIAIEQDKLNHPEKYQ